MDWTPKKADFTREEIKLFESNAVNGAIRHYSLEEIISNSEKFPIKFPVDSGRLATLLKKDVSEELTKNINSVYPFIHETVLGLYVKFIIFKRTYGTLIEKQFYEFMTLNEFVDRLLKKRAVMFMGKNDKYILLDGERGASKWETIGTTEEKAPLTLEKCLSYDEIKLSAFLYVSSYTHFVNKGDRKNKAVYLQNRALVEKTGIIAGMIGPRLKKQGVMDFQEMVITEKQNKKSNGYGNVGSIHTLFANFFEGESLLYSEAVQRRKSGAETDRFVDIKTPKGAIFDNHIYRKRLTIVFDCLLIEANQRALEAGKMAYIHLVGLGLGVWKTSDHQEKVFMDCFSNRIKTLSKQLSSVSDICFSYFKEASCGDLVHGNTIPIENHPKKGIKIHIFNRQPHEALNDEGKLLVVSYAWDGNAYPGNEYWNGQLGSSGDSAAASSTQVTELHNPQINPLVCADNLRIVSVKGKLLRLERYLEKKRNLKRKREELLEDD
ncbi:uncharacterized protein LOC109535755 isoform X1 [Dendroctonus ponderosae]|uniref:Uncharacterized protein n=2 Tax=Dendroctonus ponderosae TaxID=77166 RepID=A0AAR5P9G0_DENPD|nr:uncharacterized protein LOC109535755 isoform X1 [Dendroctonus ponderosae]KAH1013974.1 hypothetical protein HUJ04_002888 [Dendroctonus ponderosae]KAH1024128.1 hypothetical protein HUJ05_003673 [Dendroctonus ponderosae]